MDDLQGLVQPRGVVGDDLVDPALVAATVVVFAVPVFEADLVVYFSPEFTEH